MPPHSARAVVPPTPTRRTPAAIVVRKMRWIRSSPYRAVRVPAPAPTIPAAPIPIQSSPTAVLFQASRAVTSCPPKDQTAVLAEPIRKEANISRLSTPLNGGMPPLLFVVLLMFADMLNAAANARPTAAAAKPAYARRH